MKPDEYKKFMQELDDCQIKIDYSKFGKPVQYPETKKEKRQRKKEERILSKASREKPKILLFFGNRTHKNISSVSNIYTLAVIPILFLVWQIYKLISADSWQAIFHTTKTIISKSSFRLFLCSHFHQTGKNNIIRKIIITV